MLAILAPPAGKSVTAVTCEECWVFAPARRQVNAQGLLREVHAPKAGGGVKVREL